MEVIILDLSILCGFDEDEMSYVLMLALNPTPTRTPHMDYAAQTSFALPEETLIQTLYISAFIFSELQSACSKNSQIVCWAQGKMKSSTEGNRTQRL